MELENNQENNIEKQENNVENNQNEQVSGNDATKEKNAKSHTLGVILLLVLMCAAVYFINRETSENTVEKEEAQCVTQTSLNESVSNNTIVSGCEDSVVVDSINTTKTNAETQIQDDAKAEAETYVDPLWDVSFVSYMNKKYPDFKLTTDGLRDEITIKPGLILTQVALKYYGDKSYWIYLYLYNKDRIKNPNNVNVGTKVRIPNLHKSLVDGTEEKKVAVAKQVRKVFVK